MRNFAHQMFTRLIFGGASMYHLQPRRYQRCWCKIRKRLSYWKTVCILFDTGNQSSKLPDKIQHAVFAEAMSTVALKWVLQQQSTLPTLVFHIHTITKYGNWVACRCCCHSYTLQMYHCGKISAATILKWTIYHIQTL